MRVFGREKQQVKRPRPRQKQACLVGGPTRRLDGEKRVKRAPVGEALEDVAPEAIM